MSLAQCTVCGKRRGPYRPQVLVKCEQGWNHYTPAICKPCMDTYEGIMEAAAIVVPGQPQFKLDLAVLAAR